MRASIPRPSRSQFAVGPVTVRAYALCILAGIFVAIGMGRRSGLRASRRRWRSGEEHRER